MTTTTDKIDNIIRNTTTRVRLPCTDGATYQINRFRDMAIRNYPRRLTTAILDLVQPELEGETFDPSTRKPTIEPNSKWIASPVAENGQSKISKTTTSRHLGFGATESSAIRSVDLENPTVEPYLMWIGWPVAEIWPLEIFQNARSVGRWSSILHCSHVLLFTTLGT